MRTRLLAAAERLFGAKGFAHVGVRELLEEAQAGGAAVHYYFRSKTGLYRAVVEEQAPGLRAKVLEILREAPTCSGLLGLEAVLRGAVAEILNEAHREDGGSGFIHLVFRELGEPGPAYDLVRTEFADPLLEALREVIQNSCPDLPPETAGWTAASVLAQIGFFVVAHRFVGDVLDPGNRSHLAKIIAVHVARLICRGMIRSGERSGGG